MMTENVETLLRFVRELNACPRERCEACRDALQTLLAILEGLDAEPAVATS